MRLYPAGLEALRLVRRVSIGTRQDNLVLVAGGVAFFSLLSLIPVLAAFVSIYGLVADPTEIAARVDSFGAAMPPESRDLIVQQLTALSADRGELGRGLAIGIAVALYGASTAMRHLMVALTNVFRSQETRGFLRQRLVSVLYTLAAILFLAAVLGVGTILPGLGDGGFHAALVMLRWPLLLVVVTAGLTLLYRFAPDRPRPAWRWIDRGALAGTALWLVMTIAFSEYASRLGTYNKMYGASAGAVMLMLWLFLSALAVLIGAVVDVELEESEPGLVDDRGGGSGSH